MINAAIAWANERDTLEKVYNKAEELTLDERYKVVNYPFPSKYLIIKKILNKSDFQDFYAENIDFFTNEYSDPDEVTFLTSLKTILDAL